MCPINYEEYFNIKHSSVRNVIECFFELLKIQWAILRSHSFYSFTTQCRIIAACYLLHNLMKREMSIDPTEHEIDQLVNSKSHVDYNTVNEVGSSEQWFTWRSGFSFTNV